MRPTFVRTTFISTAIVAATLAVGLLTSSTAMAKKNVSLKLHNDSPDVPMKCSVHKVVTNINGTDVETLLRRYTVKPRNERPAADQSKPQYFSLPVNYIVKRLDGSVVYPRLKLTCELVGANSRNYSPLWANSDKSFSRYRFYGGCRTGAYCTARIDRK